MDYGKLAYMRLEDLNRRVAKMERPAAAAKTLMIEYAAAYEVYLGTYELTPGGVVTEADGSLLAEVVFSADGDADYPGECRLYLGDCLIGGREILLTAEKRQHTVSFACEPAAGRYETRIVFETVSKTTAITLSGISLKLWGAGLKSVSEGGKLQLFEDGGLRKALFNDDRYVYYNAVTANGAYALQTVYDCTGDFAGGTLAGGDGGFEFIYLFLDEGKLFMECRPYSGDFAAFRYVLDENVTAVDVVRREDGAAGGVLYTVQNGGLYCRLLDICAAPYGVLPQEKTLVARDARIRSVSAVRGYTEGYAVIAGDISGGLNLYTAVFGRAASARECIEARVFCGLEGG